MNDLPENLFENPAWHALQSKHRHLAVSSGSASRYPADVAPFAAVDAPGPAALQHLGSLLSPGESVWLIGEKYPLVPEISCVEILECFQMVLSGQCVPPDPAVEIVRLTSADAP